MIHAQNLTFSHLVDADMTNTETQTANLDTRGAAYASIAISLGAEINTNAVGPVISLLESDTTVVTSFATFDSNFERSAEDITTGKVVLYPVNCKPRKRYLRLSVTTATATNDNVSLAALGILSRQAIEPTGTADMADVAVIG